MKASRLAVLAATLLLLFPVNVAAQDWQEENFGGQPDGWELDAGTLVADGVLRVIPGAPAHKTGSLGDLEFSVRLRIDDDSIGVVMYRAREGGAYSVFVAPNWVELVREGPQATVLAAGEARVIPGEWVEVTVTLTASNHEIHLGGAMLTATDPDPHPPGEIVLRAEGSGTVEFDDFAMPAVLVNPPEEVTGYNWIRTGGPLGGLGYDVRMDPRDSDRMYVTDAWAGVFISEDGGVTWFPSNEGITTRVGPSGDGIPVFSLTIDSNNPDTLWVGTQHTRGIFKSTDAGATWVEKDAGVFETEGITIRGFGVEPGNSDVVYAAGELASWIMTGEPSVGNEFDMTGGIIYKTTDGGESWTQVWRGDNLARYVWIQPDDTDTVFVSTGIFDREAANSDPVARRPGGVGVLKSSDGGITWAEVNNGLENLYVGSLFLHPDDPDTLLAGTGNNTYYEADGVFISHDGGVSWARTSSEGATAVEFATSDPDVAYAANIGFVYRSEDGALTWEKVSGPDWGPPGVRAGFPIDLEVDPDDPDRVFANNYGGGNFLSEDGGRTWEIASYGYTGAQVRDIAVDPTQPGRVYAAARSGLFTAGDGGIEWMGMLSHPVTMLEWNAVAVDASEPDHVLAATNWDGALIETDDAGITWSIVVPTIGEGLGWRTIEFAPSNPEIVYGGTAAFHSAGTFASELPAIGVLKSTDGGTTWNPANDGLTATAQVAMLAIDPTDSMVVFSASTTDGMFRTRDGGASWEKVAGLPMAIPARSVAIHPADPTVILAGYERGGIYRSDDGGTTWTAQPTGLAPEAVITDIVFDPADESTVYAADQLSGVYLSTDRGETWAVIKDGLRTRAVNALAITADGEHLYAATEGEGVFRLDLSGAPPSPANQLTVPETGSGGETATNTTAVSAAQAAPQPPVSATTLATAPASDSGSSSVLMVALVIGLLALGAATGWIIGRRSRP